MTYTEKYHLPQWVEEDRIMMDDFNNAMADIDKGMDSIAQAAAEGISNTAADAAAAAQAAQAAADKALADAARAQATADAAYAPNQPPYIIGSYTGNLFSQTITVGFPPKFVIVTGSVSSNTYQYFAAAGRESSLAYLQLNDSGFVISQNIMAMGGHENYPRLTERDVSYIYIAFR